MLKLQNASERNKGEAKINGERMLSGGLGGGAPVLSAHSIKHKDPGPSPWFPSAGGKHHKP